MPSASVAPFESTGVQPDTGTTPAPCAPRSSVFTMLPDLSLTTICRSLTSLASCTPNVDDAPLDTVMLFPGASTFEPISSAACVDWPAESCVASELSDVFNWPMPDTVLICASCEVICELSAGFVGSWFLSCVTSSVRNVFCRSEADVPDVPDVLLVLLDALDAPFMVSSSVCDTVVPLLPMVVFVVTVGFLRFRWSES
ncbi:conserved hypothetical protein [Burkholderia sp. 8Y]|nr:conserved hypothetical protein [Burkholderia sp. 8Y]